MCVPTPPSHVYTSFFVSTFSRNRRLYEKNQALQEDLQDANETIAKMDDMRNQVHSFAERFRFEKDARARTEEDAIAATEKVRCCASMTRWCGG